MVSVGIREKMEFGTQSNKNTARRKSLQSWSFPMLLAFINYITRPLWMVATIPLTKLTEDLIAEISDFLSYLYNDTR